MDVMIFWEFFSPCYIRISQQPPKNKKFQLLQWIITVELSHMSELRGNSLLPVYPPQTVCEMGDSHPRSPGIAQELCLFSFFSPDQPLPEGRVNKHPGPIPPLHQED